MEQITYEKVLALFEETNKQIARLSAETDKLSHAAAETDKQIRALSVETDKLNRSTAATDKMVKSLAKQLGGITDAHGDFAEYQVRPKILKLFQARGIDLSESIFDVSVQRDGKAYVQADMVLVNTIYSVVVEVKHRLHRQDIDEHAARMVKLQKYPSRAVKGTTMYAAVAGMIVSDEVAQYAVKKGMFVVVPNGENVEVANPEDFEPTVWELQSG